MCDLRASKFHRLFKKEAEWPTHYPARSIGVRLPTGLKLGMEKLTGLNLNQVRVHYASPLPALVQAHGYAQGNQIYLALGQEHHLPHELGHVVQQMWGMVEATTEVNGVAVNDDPKLEEHATKLGQLALSTGVNHGWRFQRDRHVSSLKTLL